MKQFLVITAALSLLFSTTKSHAAVLPTTKGEGVWNITTRIASELDGFSFPNPSCNLFITQEDIGIGGSFVITMSNAAYCLNEDVTFSSGAAITIAAPGVTLDLQGHSIDGLGGSNSQTAIQINESAHNIIIQNGSIKNILGNFPFGAGIHAQNGLRFPISNILIRDMNFYGIGSSRSAIDFGRHSIDPTTIPDTDGMVIENCHFFDNNQAVWVEGSCTVRNCVVELYQPNSPVFSGGIYLENPLELSNNDTQSRFVVEDCIITGSFFTNSNGIFINTGGDTVIRNCIVDAAMAHGIVCLDQGANRSRIQISDCMVFHTRNTGFNLANNSGDGIWITILERCVAGSIRNNAFAIVQRRDECRLELIDCVAEKSRNGFSVDNYINPSSLGWPAILKRCCANGNTMNGFLISTPNAIIEDCIAQNNGSAGFTSVSLPASFSSYPLTFNNCTSQHNGTHGFIVNELVSNVIFQECIAQNNTEDGFLFVSTSSNIKTTNCFAMNNGDTGFNLAGIDNYAIGCMAVGNSTDYVGITDPTQVISYSTPGAINGIGRFVNIQS